MLSLHWVLSTLLCLELTAARLIGTTITKDSGLSEYKTCNAAAKKFKYNYVHLDTGVYPSSYDLVCGYPPATGTVLLCAYALAGNNSFIEEQVSKQLYTKCHYYSSYNNSLSYYEEQFKNATEYYIPLSQVNTSKALYRPTLPKISSLQSTYKIYQNTNWNLDAATWFSVAYYGYYLIIIMICGIYNVLRVWGVSKAINNSRIAKLCQKYLIFPSLIPNGKYSQPYVFKYLSILIPNRIQFLNDLFFCALSIGFYCANYRYTSTYYWYLYVGVRSGIMSFGKIPLLILFSGRNNFLLWITGWSYATFLHHHKMVAIWMFIDALIHSVSLTIYVLGDYVAKCHLTYFACGIAATVFAGVMILQSLHFFRTAFYEYFLTIHIVFGICFLATCWYHCNILGWMEWLVAACAVWFFDRLIRVVRMTAFGYKPATLSVITDQLFKLEVAKPYWWKHTSGTYGYIYFAGYLFWENHPFTVVAEDDKLCAYIKVKRGVTARVWKKLVANNNVITWNVCIEGPYGGKLSGMAKRYDDTIFVAGGSGAPGILEGATKASSGKFIWVSQTLEFVTAYRKLIEEINIPIDVYVTRENGKDRKCSKKELFVESDSDTQSTVSEKCSTDKEELELSSSCQISIHYGRPVLDELINTEVASSPSNNLAIIACGPPVLMDNLRNVIGKNITAWDKSVDFFDEFQTW